MEVDIARLTARAAVCKALEDAPDDMAVDVETFALVRGTSAGNIRQELHKGKLTAIKAGRRTLLRLGDARHAR